MEIFKKPIQRKGKLFVLSGPSGAGKGTLRACALFDVEGLLYSVSCTTRKPRDGEKDGVDYRFIEKDDFERKIVQGLFLEYAHVHGDFYGTLREDVERALNSGYDVLLEIDVQGAFQVKEQLTESILIFVAPPSLSILEERLRSRKTETEEKIKLRLENAQKEMLLAEKYDHVVLNDSIERASKELRGIILQYRERG